MQNRGSEFFSRRDMLRTAAAFSAGAIATTALPILNAPSMPSSESPAFSLGSAARADDQTRPLRRIAAINSIYRLRSHAYHICGRFIHGFMRDGFHHQPAFRMARMYNHQSPADDLGPAHCKQYDIELCESVAAALGGEGKLDVDAVLLIIEHGDYPVNDRGQVLYPRFELFQEIVSSFQKAGRSVPVFVDKHLSYDYQHAAEMVQTARKMKFGLMAGSSLPVTWRMPELEPPLGTPFDEAVVVYGFDRGAPDIYLFHALEVLQCMLERRPGGETGVKSVEGISGADVWRAADAGRFSWKLVEAAVDRCPSKNIGPIRENVRKPQAILVEYRDGTRGAVINLIEQVSEFAFAANVRGCPAPLSTHFYLPPPPGARFFDPLSYHIERFFDEGKPSYPVERTWLTSTVLDFGLRSQANGAPLQHEALNIQYAAPRETGFFRGPITDGE